jgi:hypothetical protein
MIDAALLDETYLMNLLGHAKLANERGRPGRTAEEYYTAATLLRVADANEQLRNELTRRFLATDAANPAWPAEFRRLRAELDQQYAPDPADLAPAKLRVSFSQIDAFLLSAEIQTLAGNLGIPCQDLFNWKRVEAYLNRPELGLAGKRLGEIATVRDTVRALIHRLGAVDPLDWYVDTLMSPEAKAAAREKLQSSLRDYLRSLIVGPQAAQQELHDARAIEHGFAEIDQFPGTFESLEAFGRLDRLSYAALERRLTNLLKRVEDFGNDLLGECDSICPRLRAVLEARVAVALELDSSPRTAVALLTGQPEAQAAAPEAVTVTVAGIDEGGGLAALRRFAQGKPAASPEEKPAAHGETFADWKDVELEWSAEAERRPFAAPLAVRRKPDVSRVGKLLQVMKLAHAARPGVEVLAGPNGAPLLSLYGLDARREELLREKLPAAAEAAAGRSFKERISNAVLGAAAAPIAPAAAAVDAVPHLEIKGDIPPSVRVLFEQALEILNPKPLTEHDGQVLESLAPPAVAPKQHLDTGEALFQCPKSLAELVEDLRRGVVPS